MKKVVFTLPSYYRGKAYGKCTGLHIESSKHNVIISPVDAAGMFTDVEVVIPKLDIDAFISALMDEAKTVDNE